MVSYNELNKVIKLAGDSTVKLLKEECVSLFKFGVNIKLDLVFQRYDPEWDAFVDLFDDEILKHKDKFKMVVQPLLRDAESSVYDVSEH